jgi:hypothetical protein
LQFSPTVSAAGLGVVDQMGADKDTKNIEPAGADLIGDLLE